MVITMTKTSRSLLVVAAVLISVLAGDGKGGKKGKKSESPSNTPSASPSNSPTTVCDAICSGGSVSYRYDRTVQTWEAHLIAARNMDCDLASVPDAETATQIQTFLTGQGFQADQDFVFIGGYNPTPGGPVAAANYVWSDGADTTFITDPAAPWFTGEPNTSTERHIALPTNTDVIATATPGYSWFDVPTTFQNGAVYKCCDSPVNAYVPLGACSVPDID